MSLATAIRLLEIAAIVEAWLAAAWLFRHVQPDKRWSISFHGGTDRTAYLVFAFTLTLHPIVFVFFNFIWLIPVLRPHPVYIPIMLLASLCQLLTAWIRDGANARLHRWHNLAALSMSALLPLLVVLLLATGRLPPTASIVNWLAIITMLLLAGTIRLTRQTRANYLWYQSAYILSFQLATIAIAVFV
jgi:hypothetical protein